MIHHGGLDDRVNHGFHNDTTPRYDKAAAQLSWPRPIDFFNKNLRTGGRATN